MLMYAHLSVQCAICFVRPTLSECVMFISVVSGPSLKAPTSMRFTGRFWLHPTNHPGRVSCAVILLPQPISIQHEGATILANLRAYPGNIDHHINSNRLGSQEFTEDLNKLAGTFHTVCVSLSVYLSWFIGLLRGSDSLGAGQSDSH